MKKRVTLLSLMAISLFFVPNFGLAAARYIQVYPQLSIAVAANKNDVNASTNLPIIKKEHNRLHKLKTKAIKTHFQEAAEKKDGKTALGLLLLLAGSAAFAFGIIALFGGAFGAPVFIGIGIAIMLAAVALGAYAFKLINPKMKRWKRWLFSLAVNVGIGLLLLVLLQLVGG